MCLSFGAEDENSKYSQNESTLMVGNVIEMRSKREGGFRYHACVSFSDWEWIVTKKFLATSYTPLRTPTV